MGTIERVDPPADWTAGLALVDASSDGSRLLVRKLGGGESKVSVWDGNGFLSVPLLAGINVHGAVAISGDGNVVIGLDRDSQNRETSWVFRGGQLTQLPIISGTERPAIVDLSHNGNVTAGRSDIALESNIFNNRPSIWTSNGTSAYSGTVISFLYPDIAALQTNAGFAGVSGSGEYLFGSYRLSPFSSTTRMYRLHHATGAIIEIPDSNELNPVQSSYDGHLSLARGRTYAYLWRAEEGLSQLPFRTYTGSFGVYRYLPSAMNGDGSRIFGEELLVYFSVAARRNVIWDHDGEMLTLEEVLAYLGIDLTGWALESPKVVSEDGRTLVGNGLYEGNPRVYRIQLPEGELTPQPPVIAFDWPDFERGYGENLVLDLNPSGGIYPYTVTWYAGQTGEETEILGTDLRLEFPFVTDSFSVWYRLSNEVGSADSNTISVTVLPPVPVYIGQPMIELLVGQYYSFPITVTWAPDAFLVEGLPAGLLLNSSSGRVSGVPEEAGDFTATFEFLLDGITGGADILFRVLPTKPRITSPLSFSGRVGRSFVYQITLSGDADSVVVQGLPAGLAFNPGSLLIHGTPTTAAKSSVAITASNAGGVALETLALTIQPALLPPAITSAEIASGTVGSDFLFTLTAQSAVDFFLVESLPAWLTFDAATGGLSGTPTEPGSVVLMVSTSKDGIVGAPVSLEILVEASPTSPKLQPVSPIVVLAGATFDVPLEITFSADTVLLESATDDPVPAWLLLSEELHLNGTAGNPGSYTIRLAGMNASGRGPSIEVNLLVLSPPEAPQMTGATLLAGQVGEPFAHPLQSSGGVIAHEGELPPGLSLTAEGVLEGTPEEPGAFELIFYASTSNPPVAGPGRSYALSIVAAANAADVEMIPEMYAVMGSPFSVVLPVLEPGDSVEITNLPDGLRWDSELEQIVGIPEKAGIFILEITAQRGELSGVSRHAILTVELRFDQVRLQGPDTVSIRAGQDLVLRYSVDLSSADELLAINPVSLPPGLEWDADTLTLSGSIPSAGEFVAVLEPVSRAGVGHPFQTRFVVSASVAAPSISNDPVLRVTVGDLIDYQLEASPGPITAFQAATLPDGLSLDRSTGRLTGVAVVAGDFPIEVFAANSAGTGVRQRLLFQVEPSADAPVMGALAGWNLVVGQSILRTILVSNLPTYSPTSPLPDGYGIWAENLPPGLNIDARTGIVSGTPEMAGEFTAILSAHAPSANSPETMLNIRVSQNSAQRPYIEGPEWMVLDGGIVATTDFRPRNTVSNIRIQARSVAAWGRASHLGGSAWEVESSVPGTHRLDLDLVESYSYSYTYSVRSGWFGRSYRTGWATGYRTIATKQVTVFVRGETIVPAPTIPASLVGRAGIEFEYSLILPAVQAVYRIREGALPPGIEFDGLRFFGMPLEPGDFVFSLVTQTSAGTSAPTNLLLRILPAAGTPVISGLVATVLADSVEEGSQLMSFSHAKPESDFVAEEAPGTSISLRVGEGVRLNVANEGDVVEFVAENLPIGLILNTSTGVIVGTPTRPGLVESFITLIGEIGRSAPQAIIFDILPQEGAPTIAALELNGRVGEYFLAILQTAGTVDSFWVERLPDALALNAGLGQISGTPDTAGHFTLTVYAFGPAGEAVPVNVGLTIRAAEGTPEVSMPFALEAQVDAAFSQILEATPASTEFQVEGLPEGLYYDPASFMIAGVPSVPGIFTLNIRALNTLGWGDFTTVYLTVAGRPGTVDVEVDSLPRILRRGEAWEGMITSVDAGAQYSAQGLPPGVILDPATGQLSGTPQATGLFAVSIQALNTYGIGSETRLVIRVGGPSLFWLADRFGDEVVLSQSSLAGLWASDFDGDGNSALMEYALGGDPHQPRTVRLPEITLDPVTKEPVFTLWRAAEASDVMLRVEYSRLVEGASWQALGPPEEVGSEGGKRRETYRDLPAETDRGFYRLRVDLQ